MTYAENIMYQVTIDLGFDLIECRRQVMEGEEKPINIFSEKNIPLMASVNRRMEAALEVLHTKTGIPLLQLKESAAYYVTANSFFFMEHFKNAFDGGATKFRVTFDLDVEKNELTSIIKDNGNGFSGLFAVPAAPVKPPEDAGEELQNKYAQEKARYERQVLRLGVKDPSGFTDYRKIIDPEFNPEEGRLRENRVISDKAAAQTSDAPIFGGRGLGLAGTATLLHHVTGGHGKILIGDGSSLTSNPIMRELAGPSVVRVDDARPGAVTVFSAPLFSTDLRTTLVDRAKTSASAGDYLGYINRIDPVLPEPEEAEEFVFGAKASPRASTEEVEEFAFGSRASPRSPSAHAKLSMFTTEAGDKESAGPKDPVDSPASRR